ncbi:hypothetical protein BsIDN1_43170 [Bacillus safensis]|uniref:Type II secretion system protein GspF domain-containing protein n=1 Tax=Bacillus safensis TaxID=561879 RepID=A0A5S9MFN9_BACIA|nr:hypothetical protein BsIDN1_43170 [Bacillus safensis]
MKKRASKVWSKKDQAECLSKLAQLIQAGYTLIEALVMVNIQLSKQQRQQLKLGIQWLHEGEPFCSAGETPFSEGSHRYTMFF